MSDNRALIKRYIATKASPRANPDDVAVIEAVLDEVFLLVDHLGLISYSPERIAAAVERMP